MCFFVLFCFVCVYFFLNSVLYARLVFHDLKLSRKSFQVILRSREFLILEDVKYGIMKIFWNVANLASLPQTQGVN